MVLLALILFYFIVVTVVIGLCKAAGKESKHRDRYE